MLEIVAVCGAGLVSSEMLKTHVRVILGEEEIEAKVESKAISDLVVVDSNDLDKKKSTKSYDIIITTSKFMKLNQNKAAEVIEIPDVINKEVVRKKLLTVINKINNN